MFLLIMQEKDIHPITANYKKGFNINNKGIIFFVSMKFHI